MRASPESLAHTSIVDGIDGSYHGALTATARGRDEGDLEVTGKQVLDRVRYESKQVIPQLYLSRLSKQEICVDKTQEVLHAWRVNEMSGTFLKKVSKVLNISSSEVGGKESSKRGKGRERAAGAAKSSSSLSSSTTDDDNLFPSFITSLDDGVSAIAFYSSRRNQGIKVHINERFASIFFMENTYHGLLDETLPELIYASLVADEDKARFVNAMCQHLFADKDRSCGLSVVVKVRSQNHPLSFRVLGGLW